MSHALVCIVAPQPFAGVTPSVGYLWPLASVQTAMRACCIAPECITKLFLYHSKSVVISLGSHSLVALPRNAALEDLVRFAVRVAC